MLVMTFELSIGAARFVTSYVSRPVEGERQRRGASAARATPTDENPALTLPSLAIGMVAGSSVSSPVSVPRTSAVGRNTHAVPTPVRPLGNGVLAAASAWGSPPCHRW